MIFSKKSQIWYVDLLVAISIVSLSVILLFSFVSNMELDKSSSLSSDAVYISEILMGSGLPENWGASNVTRPGLTNSNWRVVDSRLDSLYSLSNTKLRSLFDIESRFLIEVYEDGSRTSFSGKEYAGYMYSNPNKVSSISRYLIYDSKVVELRVSVWN